MKKLPGLFIVLIIMLLVVSVGKAAPTSTADSLYQLFDDESDQMLIKPWPLEFDSLSLGFGAKSEAQIKELLNPVFVEAALSVWGDRVMAERLLGESLKSMPLLPMMDHNKKSPSRDALLARAREFQKYNLFWLARFQYEWLLQRDPNDKEVQNALASLNSRKLEEYIRDAQKFQKSGQNELALQQVNHVLAIDSKNQQALNIKASLMQDQKRRQNLDMQISKDYAAGVQYFQNGQWDLALANFVRVINLDPNNKEALSYIQKIGENKNSGASDGGPLQ